MLVNCFLLGAAKSGTTSLSYWLGQHKDIFVPTVKETHFFTDESYYEKGLDFWMKTDYSDVSLEPIVMDCTPSYFHRPELVIPRLQPLLTDACRFIVVLRNPVHRAYSHYLHQKKNAKEGRSFQLAVLDELETETGKPDCGRWLCYLKDGMYGSILGQWFEHFDKDRFKILIFEKMILNPHSEISEIFDWLGIGSMPVWEMDFSAKTKEVRSKLLMRMASGSGGIKRQLKYILPYKIQRRLYKLAISYLSVPASQKQYSLPHCVYNKVVLHYRDDLSYLRKITGIMFDEWNM